MACLCWKLHLVFLPERNKGPNAALERPEQISALSPIKPNWWCVCGEPAFGGVSCQSTDHSRRNRGHLWTVQNYINWPGRWFSQGNSVSASVLTLLKGRSSVQAQVERENNSQCHTLGTTSTWGQMASSFPFFVQYWKWPMGALFASMAPTPRSSGCGAASLCRLTAPCGMSQSFQGIPRQGMSDFGETSFNQQWHCTAVVLLPHHETLASCHNMSLKPS